MKFKCLRSLVVFAFVVGSMALTTSCSSDGDESSAQSDASHSGDATSQVDVPTVYAFESRSKPGESSVSYSGQTARQVLIADLTTTIGQLGDRIDSAEIEPNAEGSVVSSLDFYFRFDSDSDGETPLKLTTTPTAKQATHAAISTGKDLVSKLAGNDSKTDHKDWSSAFVGWSDPAIAAHGGSTTTPEGLVIALFETLEAQAIARAAGNQAPGPDGETLPVYVTASGLDLQQLIAKFLLMAINFSQGTDDYLDDDIEGKGLLASNLTTEDAAYSELEHAWDEGFGYFGAARDYANYTDDELSAKGGRDDWQGYHDSDGDGSIDLTREFSFAAAVNAAKRDRASNQPTDFTADSFGAFLRGRAIIASAEGELSEAQISALVVERDKAVSAWEQAVAATVVHYINETIVHIDGFGGADHDFASYAKAWSEMKGFALGFQFNPRSPLTAADFVSVHQKFGDAPVSPKADATDIAAYRAGLLEARTLLATAYGFDAANLGDDSGLGGW